MIRRSVNPLKTMSDLQPRPGLNIAHMAQRFPALGYYGCADPKEVPGKAVVGDAIDDIMDITNDLQEVLWRFDRFGASDAHWHLRFLYQIHWGKHLRDLARYLHSRLRLDKEEDIGQAEAADPEAIAGIAQVEISDFPT
jgi:hypothetical protein